MTHTILESIATANPPTKGTQQQAAAFMAQVTSLPMPIRNRIQTIYDRSGIDCRHTCVADYMMDDPSRFEFFGRDWSLVPAPTTAERNRLYRRHVVPMAEDAARRALDDAAIGAGEITHVIVASCTGFFAPGLDIELVKRLELRPSTQRTLIGFMGCYAAFNAMRLAHAFCQSVVDARVLVVCAELCTLHFKVDDTLERAVVNSLFADGAAAAVFAARPEAELLAARHRPEIEIACAARQRLRDLAHEEQIRRSGQQETTGCAILIDGPFDRAQQLGRTLNLIQRDWLGSTDKQIGFVPSGIQHILIIERSVLPRSRSEVLDERTLPGLPCARYDERRHYVQPLNEALRHQARESRPSHA